ncbi:MAG: DUF4982 domain-containing protein [Phycisphaerae bacterium]|nr:DUF4982 domain-containing protein [Phycisphaerae bacterium]
MKRFIAYGIGLAAVFFGGMAAQAERVTECFNADWRFALGEQAGAAAAEFDDSGWQAVRLPHDWAIGGPFNPQESGYAGKLPWRGVGWYRKTFTLPAADAGRRVYFDFDGVMAFPKVYVNGQLAGEWDYGYMSFRVDATPYVKFGQENVIAVCADTRRHGTRWYPGAGIYRKVTMTVCEPVHIAHWGVFVSAHVVEDEADLNIEVTLNNHSTGQVRTLVDIVIIDPDGRTVSKQTASTPVSSGASLACAMAVSSPQLWDIDSPKLYTCRTIVRADGKVVDSVDVPFGIRTFEFTADDGFHLNGRRVQLYGVNLHHDLGPLGAAFNTRAMERQLEIMKDMGCNALRTSHNPPAPEVLDLCDRMGILVWDECFDKWDATSDRIGDVDLVEHNKKQLRNFVMRDRNHPSVVVWSIGNEIADIESNRSGRAREEVKVLGKLVRNVDPTRPVGMGCFIPSAVGTRVLESLDLTGWNYDRRYAPYRELFPNKPIVYSESASTLSTRGFYELPLPVEKTEYSAQLQVDSYDLNAASWSDIPDAEFQLMERDRFVAGEFVWTGFDYLGEPTPFEREARSSYFGIVDLCGIPKDRFYLYRSHWRPEATTVHILPHWNWPGREGQNVPVFVYTNGDSAELFLNGKSLGRRTKGAAPERAPNLALNKLAKASTSQAEGERAAVCATDGDEGTRWCASSGDVEQWWQVDLGEAQPVRYLAIAFEREAKNYGYTVKASKDAATWTTIATKETSRTPQYGGPRRQFHAVDAEARYVRIEFSQLRGGAWASMSEVGVYAQKVESPYYDSTYRYRLRWNDVAYEPGELKAVAYKDGKRIGESRMRTAGEPAALRLTADRNRLNATGEDLSFILVELVDAAGTVCPLAEDMVHFEVDGPGRIAGVGNGNPLSLEPFQAAYRKLFYGKAMLIIGAEPGAGGEITVKGRSEGVPTATVKLRSR